MSSAGESRPDEPASENKPLGAPRGKRPRIRISCVDQLGTCRCHHGHKPGDVFDFDRDRGKMCSMACHVGFPYIDILRSPRSSTSNRAWVFSRQDNERG